MNSIVNSIILAPLITSIINSLLINKITKKHCAILGLLGMMLSFIGILFLVYLFIFNQHPLIDENLYTWGQLGEYIFNIGYYIDSITVTMLFVVASISLVVHWYTIGYMWGDSSFVRFYAYISFFTFAMFVLVLSNNLLQMFFGWEGVGLASYLLIGFWYTKPAAIAANIKAFLLNRLGDLFLVLAIALIFKYTNTLTYTAIFANLGALSESFIYLLGFKINVAMLASLFMFIGAMTKSAQIPLHVWLPNSMEGPTPISALIHAATMVTAGVYLLIRFASLYKLTPEVLNFVAIVGASTALFIGLIAIVETDLKKIIAYSTISQLGYMVAACGLARFDLALFHLYTHAFFKATLFLGAGIIISAMHHEQNIFKMGGLAKSMPKTYGVFLIACLSLIGFPGTAGYYSKDAIVVAASNSNILAKNYVEYCLVAAMLVTAFYTFRMFFVVFHGKIQHKAVEDNKFMLLSIMLLAVPSLIAGAAWESSHAWSIFLHGFNYLLLAPMLGLACAWIIYVKYPNIATYMLQLLAWPRIVLLEKYWLDVFFEHKVVKFTHSVSAKMYLVFDKFIFDYLGVHGTLRLISSSARNLRKIQTGYLHHYLLLMISTLTMGTLYLVRAPILKVILWN